MKNRPQSNLSLIPAPEIVYAVGMQCKPFFVLSLLSLWLWNAQGKPNVVLIYTDDQGSVDAGCYGSEDLHTPAIDRLADTGIRFTNMYVPSAICSASRAGLLTGRIPTRAGVPGNVPSTKGQAGMPAAEITLAELLHDNGYATGHLSHVIFTCASNY